MMKRFFSSLTPILWVLVTALPIWVSFPDEVRAQAYPARPVRMIVPYPAGGASDVIARMIAQHLTASLGQPVIVDNRPGASGHLGTQLALKAAPDGHTMLFIASTSAINVTLRPEYGLAYDIAKDLDAVALTARILTTLAVNPSLPAKSLTEFVALAKSRPSKLNYASSGSGTSGHIAMEVFKRAAGIDLLHVPYQGGAPAVTALLGGQVDAMFNNILELLPHIKSGRLRPLGVSSLKRSQLLPDIPTIAELGYPGFEVIAWLGMVVRAGTPKNVVTRLNAEIFSFLNSNEGRRLLASGAEPEQDVKTPEQFGEFLRTDIVKWAKMIRESGIRAE